MKSLVVSLFVLVVSVLIKNGNFQETPSTDVNGRIRPSECTTRFIRQIIRESCYARYNPSDFNNTMSDNADETYGEDVKRSIEYREKRSLAELNYYKRVIADIPINRLPEGASVSIKKVKRASNKKDKTYLLKWCCRNIARCRQMRCPTAD